MRRKAMRVIGGGLIALVVITVIGVALTPASLDQSLEIGALGASIVAVVHWFIEEQREGTL